MIPKVLSVVPARQNRAFILVFGLERDNYPSTGDYLPWLAGELSSFRITYIQVHKPTK